MIATTVNTLVNKSDPITNLQDCSYPHCLRRQFDSDIYNYASDALTAPLSYCFLQLHVLLLQTLATAQDYLLPLISASERAIDSTEPWTMIRLLQVMLRAWCAALEWPPPGSMRGSTGQIYLQTLCCHGSLLRKCHCVFGGDPLSSEVDPQP